MAMRGRGRGGWRGGRGGGRGGMQVPGLKDEDGNPIAMSVVSDGPPLQFPEIELPPELDINPKDELLLLRRRDLLASWRSSAYVIQRPKRQLDSAEDEVERYSDRWAYCNAWCSKSRMQLGLSSVAAAPKVCNQSIHHAHCDCHPLFNKKAKKPSRPLSDYLTLVPEYFPEELYTDKDRRATVRGSKSAELFRKTTATTAADATASSTAVLTRLNALEVAERRATNATAGGARPSTASTATAGADAATAAAAATAGETVAGDEEDVAAYDEDDDDLMEEDDYYQGEYFDDDEGYDDPYDDGGDEGATY
eukprot:jgi/Chrzof1/3376/Cz12g23050.t1